MKTLVKNIVTLTAFAAIISLTSCENKAVKGMSSPWQITAYVTHFDTSKLIEETGITPLKAVTDVPVIGIDTIGQFQTMDGFGFTLTGGSAMLISKMTPHARHQLINELFGTAGSSLGVSYLRISIGSSDLDEHPFSYNDLKEGQTDTELNHFSLGYDTLYLIPVLQEIMERAPNLKILGSPWSAPKWMKTNNSTVGGSLKPEYYGSYATYFVKYVKAMKSVGIPVDAVTVQNEPLHPGNNPSMLMLPEEQKVFVKEYLGPAFEAAGVKTKIIIYDHNADRPDYPMSILDDPEAAKYIDGSAFHLYGGDISALSEVHKAHPNKNLYFTEQWVGAPGNFAQELQWHTENLIIGATRNWCKTVLEWNLAADDRQNPHTQGGCSSCLGAVTITGDRVERNPAYYIIGQASKFVPAGSVRVFSDMPKSIPNVAFKTPDGKIVLIAQNNLENQQVFTLSVNGSNSTLSIPAKAVVTYTF